MPMLQVKSYEADKALQLKPIGTKRSLASTLSIDNNDDATISTRDSGGSNKRRKLRFDSKWTLQIDQIPELPFLYLREKTSVVVLNQNPQDIANRIVDCSQSLNIIGHYDGHRAKATLIIDNLEFSIQLFKVTANLKKGVIVEVQRVKGSSIQFHKVARIFLQIAMMKTKHDTKRYDYQHTYLLKSDKKRSEQDENFTCIFTLELVDELLKKDRVDANLLGMESLQYLTSGKYATKAMVDVASRAIITGERFPNIKDTISSLITKYTIDDESQHNDIEEKYYDKMRVCALSVLSSSLNSFFTDNDDERKSTYFDSILLSDDWIGDNGLMKMLLAEIQNAKNSPHQAYLAAKCLEVVLRHSTQSRHHAIELGVRAFITESLLFGQTAYALLELVSERILDTLGENKE